MRRLSYTTNRVARLNDGRLATSPQKQQQQQQQQQQQKANSKKKRSKFFLFLFLFFLYRILAKISDVANPSQVKF